MFMSYSVLYRAALTLAIFGVGLLPGGSATAGVLDSTSRAFNGTVNPLGGSWQGEEFLGSAFGSALIDWAVFESSDFDLFLTDIGSSASNPSSPGEFVYAYQLLDISSFNGVSALTVGLDGDETISGPTAPDPSWLDAGEFTANHYPFVASNQGTSMAWQWSPLAASGSTTILFFTSPNLPELDNATMPQVIPAEVLGVIGSPSNQTPIPEPATCFLALSGLAVLGSIRRARR